MKKICENLWEEIVSYLPIEMLEKVKKHDKQDRTRYPLTDICLYNKIRRVQLLSNFYCIDKTIDGKGYSIVNIFCQKSIIRARSKGDCRNAWKEISEFNINFKDEQELLRNLSPENKASIRELHIKYLDTLNKTGAAQ
jgi:hypothetical protein